MALAPRVRKRRPSATARGLGRQPSRCRSIPRLSPGTLCCSLSREPPEADQDVGASPRATPRSCANGEAARRQPEGRLPARRDSTRLPSSLRSRVSARRRLSSRRRLSNQASPNPQPSDAFDPELSLCRSLAVQTPHLLAVVTLGMGLAAWIGWRVGQLMTPRPDELRRAALGRRPTLIETWKPCRD